MDVKEAVAAAKTHVMELFSEEQLTNLGLEEIDYLEGKGVWDITIAFSRPWDRTSNSLVNLALPELQNGRTYKVVEISDKDGRLIKIRNKNI